MLNNILENPGELNGSQVQSQQSSDSNDRVLETLRNIKKYFQERRDLSAQSVLNCLFFDMNSSIPRELFGYKIGDMPYSLNDVDSLAMAFSLHDPDEDFDSNRHSCSEGQFLMRKILLAASLENSIEGLQNEIDDLSYNYGYTIVNPGEGYWYSCDEAIGAIQSIIDDIESEKNEPIEDDTKQSQNQTVSGNDITFKVERGDKDGDYNVSFECPGVGVVSNIGVHSNPNDIDLDAIDCVAKHLLIAVELVRRKRAKSSVDESGDE